MDGNWTGFSITGCTWSGRTRRKGLISEHEGTWLGLRVGEVKVKEERVEERQNWSKEQGGIINTKVEEVILIVNLSVFFFSISFFS
jgi:hypothetical protein